MPVTNIFRGSVIFQSEYYTYVCIKENVIFVVQFFGVCMLFDIESEVMLLITIDTRHVIVRI